MLAARKCGVDVDVHGLHGWVDTKREDSLCQGCHSTEDVEDERLLLFDCPAYNDIRTKEQSVLICFSRLFLFQTFSLTLGRMHVVVFSQSVFHIGSLL